MGGMGGPRASPKSKKLVFLLTVVNFKGALGAAKGSAEEYTKGSAMDKYPPSGAVIKHYVLIK